MQVDEIADNVYLVAIATRVLNGSGFSADCVFFSICFATFKNVTVHSFEPDETPNYRKTPVSHQAQNYAKRS